LPLFFFGTFFKAFSQEGLAKCTLRSLFLPPRFLWPLVVSQRHQDRNPSVFPDIAGVRWSTRVLLSLMKGVYLPYSPEIILLPDLFSSSQDPLFVLVLVTFLVLESACLLSHLGSFQTLARRSPPGRRAHVRPQSGPNQPRPCLPAEGISVQLSLALSPCLNNP